MANKDRFDWVIAGAGVIGLALAYKLRLQFPNDTILVIEKEPKPGAHASGRNSGVLHAGLYYKPDSIKAKLCVRGKEQMKAFCAEHDVTVNEVGKVLIAQNETEDAAVDTLMQNGKANGTPLSLIDDKQLAELEPAAARTGFRAIHSPSTAVVAPLTVLDKMQSALRALSVKTEISHEEEFLWANTKKQQIVTDYRTIDYGHFINACGAYADRVAHEFKVGLEYFLLPFRGAYKKLHPDCPLKVNGNIYPVPDLNMPFLGVHFTRGSDGSTGIGPTAFPALGAEHYTGLFGIEWGRLPKNLGVLARKYAFNQNGFRNLAHREIQTLTHKGFFEQAKRLVPDLKPEHIVQSKKVGIRAQLVERKSLDLIMDFKVVSGSNSTHILNAVSPAFTCSLSFADYVLESYLKTKA